MKNFPSDKEIEKEPIATEWFDREKVVKAFGKIGFVRDYEEKFVIVLRNSSFPFRRIVLPSIGTLHIELLKLYAQDLRISFPQLINLLS